MSTVAQIRRWIIAIRALALAPALSAGLSAATVAPLDGPLLKPAVVTVTADAVLGDGQPLMPLRDVDWIEFAPSATAIKIETPNSAPGLGVWLTDGSWLPVSAITAGTGDTVQVTSIFGTHALPLSTISSWGTSETAAASAGLDRVMVASGPVDGRVQGLRDGKLLLATTLDPEPLALELSEIQGLRLAQSAQRATGMTLLVTLDANRPALRLVPTATGMFLAASRQALNLQPSQQQAQAIALSTLAGLRVRVDGGRRTWLSDVTPTTVSEKGAFDVVWPWQRDRALDGGPLLLGGVRYAKGLTVHSAATMTWTLSQKYVRLRALIGIADAVAPEGDCPVTLSGDSKTIWRAERLRGGENPQMIDVDVRGITSLTLDIAIGERFDIGDHVLLADAYLVQIGK